MPNKPPQAQYARRDALAALQQAAVQLDATYITPVETHNPMELTVIDGGRMINQMCVS